MNNEVTISPYEEWEKRVINGKVENVVYHTTDWQIVFGNKMIATENYTHKTVITADELQERVKERENLQNQEINNYERAVATINCVHADKHGVCEILSDSRTNEYCHLSPCLRYKARQSKKNKRNFL